MMLKELMALQGVSGYEHQVVAYIKEIIEKWVDTVSVDALGNLIAFRKGTGAHKKKIMCAAHTDEIGVQVIKLMPDGFAKVRSLGGVSPVNAYMQRVCFTNGLTGVLSNYKKASDIQDKDFATCYVDFGFKSKEALEKHLKVGDVASFVGDYVAIDDDRIMGKALDDRVGCYIMIKSIEDLYDKPLYNDVYFVFTAQEEVGLRGAKVAANAIGPDIGIPIDITGSFDTPNDDLGNAVIGGGAAIKVSDASVICNPFLVEKMTQCAEDNAIPSQLDVMTGGGTDGGAMNLSNNGVKIAGISVPTRYGHSPNSIVSYHDVKACYDLLTAYVNLDLSEDKG